MAPIMLHCMPTLRLGTTGVESLGNFWSKVSCIFRPVTAHEGAGNGQSMRWIYCDPHLSYNHNRVGSFS